jgi:DNA-binding NarL/FixJ family response regulator
VALLAVVGPVGAALARIRNTAQMLGTVPLVVLAEQVHRGEVYTALRTGAKAMVSIDADPEDLHRAIEAASRDKIFLSADVAELVVSDLAHVPPSSASVDPNNMHLSGREMEIIRLLWDGLSTKEIARRLHVSFKTIENHRYNIYHKCGSSGLASLFRYAVRNAIVAV